MSERPPGNPADPPRPARRRAARATSSLDRIVQSSHFEGKVESKESRKEMESRLRIEEADAEHARWRDRLVLRAGLVSLAIIGVYCLVLNALPGEPVERRAWATATLTGIVGGMIGYVLGTSKKAA